MTRHISRRGFLNGLMAAAAIVAIAPQVFAGAPVETATAPLTVTPEFGDLWARFSGKGETWRFIGKVLTCASTNEPIEISSLLSPESYREFAPNPMSGCDFELATDADGDMLLRGLCFSGDDVDIMMGAERGHHVAEHAFVRGFSENIDFRTGLCHTNLSVDISRPVVYWPAA